MKLISCNANRALSEAIADHLDCPLTDAEVKNFADNEIFVRINENVRGEDVFVIQSTSRPANDNLMELLYQGVLSVHLESKLTVKLLSDKYQGILTEIFLR